MYSRCLFLLLILTFSYLCPSFTNTLTQKNSGFNPTLNDSILELFNDCKCIPYYQCSEASRFMLVAGSGDLPDNLTCSDSNYFCCNTSTAEDSEENETEPPVIITKEPVYGISCGTPRSLINVRVLTPETESATIRPGEIPWVVEVMKKTDNLKRPYQYKCIGSLIHPQVVVTTTHCVRSSGEESLKIVSNSRGIFREIGDRPKNERNIIKIIRHPDYYSGGLHNDIALLILEKQYDFAKNLNSICLPTIANFTGKRCIAVGWGNNPEHEKTSLRKVDVPIVEFSQCQELLRKTHLGPEFGLHSSFMCAGGEEGKDTCKGDGGSPLMCMGEDYKYVLAGIVSWGVNCGVEKQPGVYTDVGKFKDWIRGELAKYQIVI
ncbi:phenoloxidase-activating factor 2 [Tribolium castaneum]|uniref:Serine protease H1 n=1 Tax=Tribolium castaneum TaxID=7070 RepID=D6WBT1_TRICA|nr:PREDICTED: trypsin II-P29 [Tribolium castaneum]EEZ99180.1 serine protease H1 [Tribolium castaneum]|eukprot:XP_008190343.1 PREDICTED: trypsin II-P29 [Tribolium castaneum]